MYQIANEFIVCKLEDTPGEVISLSDSDFNLFPIDGTIKIQKNIELDMAGSKPSSYKNASRKGLPGLNWANISFSLYYRHSGENGQENKNSKMYQSCGLKKTSSLNYVSWASIKTTNDVKPLTIAYYVRKRGSTNVFLKTLLSGCMGNCIISTDKIGGVFVENYTYKGVIVSETDEITTPNIGTRDNTLPPKLLNSYTTFAGIQQLISAFSLDFGNNINYVIDQGNENKIAYFRINSRDPTININPYSVSISTQDIYSKFKGVTEGPFYIYSPYVNTKFNVYAPNAQIQNVTENSREGLKNNEITFQLNKNNYSFIIDDDASFELLHGTK